MADTFHHGLYCRVALLDDNPPSLVYTTALPFILQHICLGTQPQLRDASQEQLLQEQHANSKPLQSVARLLCTCKSMQAAITQSCKGLLDVLINSSITATEPTAVESWLAHHGQLLGTLRTRLPTFSREADVIQALKQAAAASGGLPVKHLEHRIADPNPGGYEVAARSIAAIFSAIHSSSLVSLTLTVAASGYEGNTCSGWILRKQELCFAMKKFSILQSLTLACDRPVQHRVLTAIGRLQHLTAVHFGCINTVADVGLMPPQLVECSVAGLLEPESTRVQLGHLTALTYLSVKGWTVATSSLLPQNLCELHLQDIQEVGDVLPLRHLQRLALGSSSYWGRKQLQQLSCLSSLQQLGLRYETGPEAVSAAPAWHALPLCELSICNAWYVRPPVADISHQLYKLTGLTSLHLIADTQPFAATPRQLADTLQQLTILKQLTLYAQEVCSILAATSFDDKVGAAATLGPSLQVLSRLSQLRQLTLRTDLSDEDVDVLAAAGSHLTSLDISREGGMDAYGVCMLAHGLTQLRSLSVGLWEDTLEGHMKREFEDGPVIAISHCLTQLTHLAIRSQAVDDRAAKHLSKLQQLAVLDVRYTQVTGDMLYSLMMASRGQLVVGRWGDAIDGEAMIEL